MIQSNPMGRFAVLALAAAVAACSSGGTGPTGSGTPAPSGGTLTLDVGDAATLPGTSITLFFQAVTEDSRCPTDVVCVWEGNAQVAVTLASAAGRLDSRLNTTSEPRRIEFGGVALTLASLAPYPAGQPIDPDAYRATFEVDPD